MESIYKSNLNAKLEGLGQIPSGLIIVEGSTSAFKRLYLD